MDERAQRTQDIIRQSIAFSNSGEIGKALDLLDDFLAEIAWETGDDSLNPDDGLSLPWLRQWTGRKHPGNPPTYVSRMFLVLLLRSLASRGPRWIISPVLGMGDLLHATGYAGDPVAMGDLTFLRQDPVRDPQLEAPIANPSAATMRQMEATNLR